MALGILLFFINVVKTTRTGRRAPNDPWLGRHARVVHDVPTAGVQLRQGSRTSRARDRSATCGAGSPGRAQCPEARFLAAADRAVRGCSPPSLLAVVSGVPSRHPPPTGCSRRWPFRRSSRPRRGGVRSSAAAFPLGCPPRSVRRGRPDDAENVHTRTRRRPFAAALVLGATTAAKNRSARARGATTSD